MVSKITSPVTNNDTIQKINEITDYLPEVVKARFNVYETLLGTDGTQAETLTYEITSITVTNYAFKFKPFVVFTNNSENVYQNSSQVNIKSNGHPELTFVYRHQEGQSSSISGYILLIPMKNSDSDYYHCFGNDNGGYRGESYTVDEEFSTSCLQTIEAFTREVTSTPALETTGYGFASEGCYSHTFSLPDAKPYDTSIIDIYLTTYDTDTNGFLYKKVYSSGNPGTVKLYFYKQGVDAAPTAIKAKITLRKFDRATGSGDAELIRVHYEQPFRELVQAYVMEYPVLSTDVTVTLNSTTGLYEWTFSMATNGDMGYEILLPPSLRGHVKQEASWSTRYGADEQGLSMNVIKLYTDLSSVPSYINWWGFIGIQKKGATSSEVRTNGYLDLLDSTPTSGSSKLLTSGLFYNTAVTHTSSTAVGSTSQPVYIASNGKATAISYKFWVGTQTEYNNIQTKDSSTIYFIKAS